MADAAHIRHHFDAIVSDMEAGDCIAAGFHYEPVTSLDGEDEGDDLIGRVLMVSWNEYSEAEYSPRCETCHEPVDYCHGNHEPVELDF